MGKNENCRILFFSCSTPEHGEIIWDMLWKIPFLLRNYSLWAFFAIQHQSRNISIGYQFFAFKTGTLFTMVNPDTSARVLKSSLALYQKKSTEIQYVIIFLYLYPLNVKIIRKLSGATILIKIRKTHSVIFTVSLRTTINIQLLTINQLMFGSNKWT